MNNKVLLDNLRCIPDFPKKGINFRDVTTLYKNAECVKIMLDELERIYKDKGITKIVGIESSQAHSRPCAASERRLSQGRSSLSRFSP